ncbi:hypothetical protein [Nocardioides sp. CFH 31398]|uniref:hypothetical protein n=1 Tax=Nocardioides sp. CFH 31398 TaxID=2919579 RepID=UPI001F06D032|nr:hypothetical protein [Nocardioides sp. CFH 31398]MCH1868467.1 hypothetical protein [Nocardioides sp. CFH 31398]
MAKPRPKHRAAKHRAEKPRPTRAAGTALVAAPVAATVTVGAIGVGLSTGAADDTRVVVSEASGFETIGEREVGTSRSGEREAEAPETTAAEEQAARAARAAERQQEQREAEQAETLQAVRQADDQLWTTTELNIWTDSEEAGAEQLGVLDSAKKVLVTGRSEDGREEIVLDGQSRWVTAGYLSAEKPAETGLDVECTNGTTYATPVSQNIVDVHRVVCGNFPEISTYGTLRSDGEHAQGIAMDIMVSGDRGWEVANFLQANAAELGINYLIYSQQIWSVERSGEGWRGMEDRGSTTANHYDHVHVTTY